MSLVQLTTSERAALADATVAIGHGIVPIDAFAASARAHDTTWDRIAGPYVLAGVDKLVRRKTEGRLTLDDITAALAAADERTAA